MEPKRLLVVFTAVAVLNLIVGWCLYSWQEGSIRVSVVKRLQIAANLKVERVVKWREDLLRQGEVLRESPYLVTAVAEWFQEKQSAPPPDLVKKLESLQKKFDFEDILLLDPTLKVRLDLYGEGAWKSFQEYEAIGAARERGETILTEPHTEGVNSRPHLAVVVPLFASAKDRRFIGAFVLKVNPYTTLFPMVSVWPVPSETAEMLLVRKVGDRVLRLNEYRHRPELSSLTAIPLSEVDPTTASAVTQPKPFFEGADYRGVAVISVSRQIPSTDCFLIAKEDSAEAMREWRFRAAVIIVIVTLATLTVAALLVAFYQRSAKHGYLERYLLEKHQGELAARYQTTLQAVGDSVLAADADGLVILMNPAAEALIGWKDSEAVGRPLGEVFRVVEGEGGGAQGKGSPLATDVVLLTRDGRRVPVTQSASPILDEAGKSLGVVLVARDQTARQAALDKLEESEAGYRNLFNSMQEGFALHEIITDDLGRPVDCRFLEANPAFERITGLKSSEIRGRRLLEVMPETGKRWIEHYGSVALTGVSATFTDYNSALDKYFEVFAYRQSDGTFACLFRDTTEEVKAKKAIEKRILALTQPLGKMEQVEFSDLFDIEEIQEIQDRFAEAAGVASLITDPSGLPLTRRSNFTRLCGDIIRGTALGRENCQKSASVLGAVNPGGPTISHCLSGGLLDAGAAITVGGHHVANWLIGQVRDEAFDHERIVAYAVEIGADPVEFAAALDEVPAMSREQFGKVAAALYVLADQLSAKAYQNVLQARFIADRKRSEDEKAALMEKLHQAEKLESVGRLAGGVAHDFNNMLSVIIGHTEYLIDKVGLEDPIREDLEEIMKAATRSAQITKHLLAFAKRQPVSPRVMDLNAAVASSIKMLGRLIGEDIELEWIPGKGLWPVKMDPTQLDQVLANLAANARDAVTRGGRVTIAAENKVISREYAEAHGDMLPGEYVQLSVSDTGSGIDEKIMPSIFEPFFTTKQLGQGTGLGLATVWGIARQNGGYVTVNSQKGVGTAFRLYLPRLASDATEKVETECEPLKGGGQTLLLVEDEVGLLNLGKKVLTNLGYNVLAAESPAMAMELARGYGGEISLLVTDVIMPGMNGRELADRLKAERPGLKVLYLSGYTADVIASRGLLEEGAGFVAKPFTIRELGNKVRQVLLSAG